MVSHDLAIIVIPNSIKSITGRIFMYLGHLELALVTIVAELFPAFGAMLKSITLIDFEF